MPCRIDLARVLSLADPVACPPWLCGLALQRQHVVQAIASRRFRSSHVSKRAQADPVAHAERIAWFVCHGWREPIEVDVGIPSVSFVPSWAVLDGNHRLYAAAVRRDVSILVRVQGAIAYAAEMFAVREIDLIEPD